MKVGDTVAKANGSQFYTSMENGSVATQLYGKIERIASPRRKSRILVHGNYYSEDELTVVNKEGSNSPPRFGDENDAVARIRDAAVAEVDVAAFNKWDGIPPELKAKLGGMTEDERREWLSGHWASKEPREETSPACNTKNAPADDGELIQGLTYLQDTGLEVGDKVTWSDERSGADYVGRIERLAVYAWVREDYTREMSQQLASSLELYLSPEMVRKGLEKLVAKRLEDWWGSGGQGLDGKDVDADQLADEIVDRVIDTYKSGRLG